QRLHAVRAMVVVEDLVRLLPRTLADHQRTGAVCDRGVHGRLARIDHSAVGERLHRGTWVAVGGGEIELAGRTVVVGRPDHGHDLARFGVHGDQRGTEETTRVASFVGIEAVADNL